MPSWFSSHLTHTHTHTEAWGDAERVGVGYQETRASNWGLETEIYQLEPSTYRVCVCSILVLTQTHTYGGSKCHTEEGRMLHRGNTLCGGSLCVCGSEYNLIAY